MGKIQDKTIGDVKYTVARFPGGEAIKIQAYLMRNILPAITKMLGGIDIRAVERAGLAGLSLSGLSDGVAQICQLLDEDEFIKLLRRLFANVQATVTLEGKPRLLTFAGDGFDVAMDACFEGNTSNVYLLLLFVLEVNYPDFFTKAKGLLGSIGKKLGTPTQAEDAGTSLI